MSEQAGARSGNCMSLELLGVHLRLPTTELVIPDAEQVSSPFIVTSAHCDTSSSEKTSLSGNINNIPFICEVQSCIIYSDKLIGKRGSKTGKNSSSSLHRG